MLGIVTCMPVGVLVCICVWWRHCWWRHWRKWHTSAASINSPLSSWPIRGPLQWPNCGWPW